MQGTVVNIFATPPAIIENINVKYCPLCYQHHGQVVVGTIERGPSNYCPKHYRIQSSRNKALSRGLYSPSLKELEAMIPHDMKCRICDVTMIHSVRDGSRNDIMSLQHWRNNTVEWICLRCNASHGTTIESDETWTHLFKDLKETEKFCPLCKKVKDVSFFYKAVNGSKGRTAYCQICHNDYTKEKRSR